MKGLIKKEDGFGLVDVLVGLAIIGIVAAGFLLTIANTYKANIIADERTTADSLARAQMESVKAQGYITAAADGEDVYTKLDLIGDLSPYKEYGDAGYEILSVWIVADEEEINEDALGIIAIPWDSQSGIAATTDVGLQKITLVIMHNEKEVLRLEQYKVYR